MPQPGTANAVAYLLGDVGYLTAKRSHISEPKVVSQQKFDFDSCAKSSIFVNSFQHTTIMRIHFIAIGGAAMHNLAIAVSEKQGYTVTGSDDEIFDPARSRLEAHGLLPAETGWHPERITADLDAVILGRHARAQRHHTPTCRLLLQI